MLDFHCGKLAKYSSTTFCSEPLSEQLGAACSTYLIYTTCKPGIHPAAIVTNANGRDAVDNA